MKTLDGFILTRHWRDTPSGTVVDFWLATDHGAKLLRRTNIVSVSFAPAHYQEDVEAVVSTMQDVTVKRLDLMDFYGRPILGIYSKNFRQQATIEKNLKTRRVPVYEADIRPPERYLMERFLTASVSIYVNHPDEKVLLNCKVLPNDTYRPSLKVVSLTMEADEAGALKLISLYNPEHSTVISLQASAAAPDVDPPNLSEDFEVIQVGDHAEMIKELNRWFCANDPDAIIGWNLIQVELRVLQIYADRHNVPLKLGRDGSPIDWRENVGKEGSFFATVAGRAVIAGGEAIKTALASFMSATLDNVIEALLPGVSHPEHPHKHGSGEPQAYTIDRLMQLARYSMMSSLMVFRIFDETKLLRFMMDRASVTGLQVDNFRGSIAAFEHQYLPRMHREGFVAPNVGDVPMASYPRGHVLDSKPGLYDSVIVLDYKSLYASIIRTFLVDPVGMAAANDSNDETQIIFGINGTKFSRTRHCLPAITSSLWKRSDQAKLDNNEPLSEALKLLMNSFFGVLGSPDCRFFDPKLVSAMTLRGHDIISRSRDIIEAQGYAVIYGDTDSIFISLDEAASNDRAQEIAEHLVDVVNQWWREFTQTTLQIESELEIEFDTHYQRFFLPTLRGTNQGSKKRFAGLVLHVNGEQKIVYRGLESTRSDWTPLARQFQHDLYQRIFHDQPFEDFIRNYVKLTREGIFDHRLIYKKRIPRKLTDYVKNVPPQVLAAKLADEISQKNGQPMKYQSGGWISYVITINGPQPVEHVQSLVDYEHYIGHQLAPIADSILVPLNTNFSIIVSDQRSLF
ncbi:DNA polymerase II [Pseudomonas sp. HN11]|uniref:DNA polymerase II n=1 Tax=Pseudomonas sp. HN11 TaxID=1344094 RepID=UPI001F398C79|nr:DNA polymerase II [Pseudomonas sp. HN11]UII69616.1 DNA polymerase II [Pseudomonas sp. HN11]